MIKNAAIALLLAVTVSLATILGSRALGVAGPAGVAVALGVVAAVVYLVSRKATG